MIRRLCATASVLVFSATSAFSETPPAAAFGRLPQVVQAELSPDGKRIAILGGSPTQRSVAVATIDQQDLPAFPLGDIETIGIRWAGNDHILTRVAYLLPARGLRQQTIRMERNVVVGVDAKAVSRLLDNDVTSEMLTGQPILGVAEGGIL